MIEAGDFAFTLGRVIESRSPLLRHRLTVGRDPSRADVVARVSFTNAADTVHARLSEASLREHKLPLAFFAADIIGAIDRIEEARVAIRDLVDP